MSNMGLHTSPDSHQPPKTIVNKKAMSVRASNPDMADIQLDMKKEREKLNRVLHIKEKSLQLGQQHIEKLNKQLLDKEKKFKKSSDAQRKTQKANKEKKLETRGEYERKVIDKRDIDHRNFMSEWRETYHKQLKDIEAHLKDKREKEKEIALNDYKK